MNERMDKLTALVWGLWLAAVLGSFGVLETEAIQHKRWHTLSRFVWKSMQVWPPLGMVYGAVFAGLGVHFASWGAAPTAGEE